MDILIIDDDAALARGIALYLKSNGPSYRVRIAVDGEEAARELAQALPDLIVLDVMLPDISGFELCRHIKEEKDIPIIYLSSLGETEDRITGLLAGGDDYMTKPFSLTELRLRIEARLRESGKRVRTGEAESADRSGNAGSEGGVDKEKPGGTQENGYLRYGEVALRKQVLTGGRRDVPLTETEYRILLLLARNPGCVVSAEEIYRVVWGQSDGGDLRTVQSHMANLRRKLEEAYETKEHIRTRWGEGYLFQE